MEEKTTQYYLADVDSLIPYARNARTHSEEQSSLTNGVVLDCFLGSASTLIACEQMDRICYGVELEEKFVDVAVERYRASAPDGEVVCIREGKEYSYDEIKAMMPEADKTEVSA